MNISNKQMLEEMYLMLLYNVSCLGIERDNIEFYRCLEAGKKNISYKALIELESKDLIHRSKGSKRVFLTEEGKAEAKRLILLENKANASHTELIKDFEFRNIHADEADQAAEIEQICFPPNEACSAKDMKERVAKVPELFMVAIDKGTGKIAGFINGIATNEASFRDEFFTDVSLHDANGMNIMVLGLDVLPEYRGQGLAREILRRYLKREGGKGRKNVVLTCLESKVEMYKKLDFYDAGISGSTWGGEEWHEMRCSIAAEQ